MFSINATHDAALRSWVESANHPDTDFPIQNLPFGVFDAALGSYDKKVGPRGGVALGDQIIDLHALIQTGLLQGDALSAAHAAAGADLKPLFEQSTASVSALRAALSTLFAVTSTQRERLAASLVPMQSVRMLLPTRPPAFTDFCCSIDHIRRMAPPGQPLRQAWTQLPVAYNGRASSVVVSGTPLIRPQGQFQRPASEAVHYGAEPSLDFELELGAWLTRGSELGKPVAIDVAQAMLFGCSLVNDWSARAIQMFEMTLGPYLGKSFLTTISPWIVTLEALAPFGTAARGRTAEEPAIAAHLLSEPDRLHGALAIELSAALSTPAMRAAGIPAQRIARSQFADMFWTLAQMVTHQASNGAPLQIAELIASGTVSGAARDAKCCLAEINKAGEAPIALPQGESRSWLKDGDELSLHGRAHAKGFVSIGFGECVGRIEPAQGAT